MAESKTLLSQKEIDALVEFLQGNKGVPIGTVLDQTSIDKLIELVRFNNSQGIYFGKQAAGEVVVKQAAVLDDTSDINEQLQNCSLEYSIGANGYVEIYCVNSISGKSYKLTPACLEQRKYVPDDDTPWGYAITPKAFNKLANLFGIKYTTQTFSNVCHSFAKLMYGSENSQIAREYFPPEELI